jgi:hypothetical protein
MIQKYLFIIILFAAGCQTNPPDPYNENVKPTGKVFLSSDIPGADILVNNTSTGKVTPDTITITAGTHLVSLRKSGYAPVDTVVTIAENSLLVLNFILEESTAAKLVLLEDFANVSCGPCVLSNEIIHSLDSYSYKDKIAVIKYATWWPGASDPFYLSAKAECDKRIAYYNIVTAPTVIVDGTRRPSPQDSIKVKEALDARFGSTPQFKMAVSMSISGENVSAEVDVSMADTSGLDFTNLVLHTVIVEKYIEFSSPPGSNGETKFYHVMRSMLPTADGEQLKNENFIYQRSTVSKGSWNKSQLSVIAFIQNKTTREIIQSGINK